MVDVFKIFICLQRLFEYYCFACEGAGAAELCHNYEYCHDCHNPNIPLTTDTRNYHNYNHTTPACEYS